MLVKPAAYASPLKRVVQTARECLVGVAVADEAGVKVYGLANERRGIGDEGIRDTSATQKRFGIAPRDATKVSIPMLEGPSWRNL